MKGNQSKEPSTSDVKGSKDKAKIQKKIDINQSVTDPLIVLDNIISSVSKSDSSTFKKVGDKISFLIQEFYKISESNDIYWSGRNIRIKGEWYVLEDSDIKTKLYAFAKNKGFDTFIIKKINITKFFNNFLEYTKNNTQLELGADKVPNEINHKEISPLEEADIYVKKKYPQVKYNIITDIVSFNDKEKTPESVYTEIKMKGIKINLSDFKTYLASDKIKRFDPFLDYFNDLPKWDGETDYIDKLASYVHTDDTKFWKQMFKKHLVRSVRQALAYGMPNRFVIVLVSEKESLGKSTFIRFLNPFKGEYYSESTDRDLELKLTKTFIYNFEEIEEMTSKEFANLKAVISKEGVDYRLFYTQNVIMKPRRCSFWASTNKTEFLGSGENTRWIIIKVNNIEFDYTKDMDINDVWSQAYALFKDKDYNSILSKKEKFKAFQVAGDSKYKSNEAHYIEDYFVKSDPDKAPPVSATLVTEYINATFKTHFKANRIGTALTDMSFKKKNHSGISKYYIELKDGGRLSQDLITEIRKGINYMGDSSVSGLRNNEPF